MVVRLYICLFWSVVICLFGEFEFNNECEREGMKLWRILVELILIWGLYMCN